MAAKILTGEADISQMPVEYAPQVTKMYNAANCEALGVTIPDGYEPDWGKFSLQNKQAGQGSYPVLP